MLVTLSHIDLDHKIDLTPEQIQGLGLFHRMLYARYELQQYVERTGYNSYAKYGYYTLDDILPAINALAIRYNMFHKTEFQKDPETGQQTATLRIINLDDPDDVLEFKMEIIMSEGRKDVRLMQDAGAIQTYARRYLYITAYELGTTEDLDSKKPQNWQQNRDYSRGQNRHTKQPTRQSSKPAAKRERSLNDKVVKSEIAALMNLALKESGTKDPEPAKECLKSMLETMGLSKLNQLTVAQLTDAMSFIKRWQWPPKAADMPVVTS